MQFVKAFKMDNEFDHSNSNPAIGQLIGYHKRKLGGQYANSLNAEIVQDVKLCTFQVPPKIPKSLLEDSDVSTSSRDPNPLSKSDISFTSSPSPQSPCNLGSVSPSKTLNGFFSPNKFNSVQNVETFLMNLDELLKGVLPLETIRSLDAHKPSICLTVAQKQETFDSVHPTVLASAIVAKFGQKLNWSLKNINKLVSHCLKIKIAPTGLVVHWDQIVKIADQL